MKFPNLLATQPKSPSSQDLYARGMTDILDLISPADFIVTPNYLQLNDYYIKTIFVYAYPSYVQTNWLSPVITFDVFMDISMSIYPIESKKAMEELRKRIGQMESSYRMEKEKGLVSDPELETAMENVERLRFSIQRGELKLFQFSLYFTVYAKDKDELESISSQLESGLGGKLIFTKSTFMQMEQGFNSTLPIGLDELLITRNMDTGSLSTTFPFTSTTLTTNEGILYGINRHNNSLVLFDRFSMENANMVVFATSGAGKSYAIKLETIRSLMFGCDVIVIDPEDEYKKLCDAVGGGYLPINLNSDKRINPFDLPTLPAQTQGSVDNLRSAIITLHGLINLMVGGMTATEDAILDRALFETYALKDITSDPATQKNPPPLMSDLYNVLANMGGAEELSKKLHKYVEGTYAGLFNQASNFDLTRGFLVFSIRDLEDELRPIAMYLILNYIWTQIKTNLRRRVMIIDEAWWMMQYEDSAKFLFSLAKRARKYYLGLTIISQDVEDMLENKYGKAVVSNAALQLLLKQSPSAVDKVAEVFDLTEGEKYMLLSADIGEGLFFAGLNHVALKIMASTVEDQIITSDPQQLLEMQSKLTPNQGGV